MWLLLTATGFGPLVAQKSLNRDPLGGTRRQPMVHSCRKVQVPKPDASGGEQLKRMPGSPPIGATPPHIRPSHCVFAPAVEPLLKSAGLGCAVTVRHGGARRAERG